MRYPAEHKDRIRKRIVRAASRRFRAKGGEGAAIAGLMRDLGLTHGGFYRHFASKEQLFDEALLEGADQALARLTGAAQGAPAGHELRAIIETYLSAGHCGNPAEGCPVAALATEIGRQGKRTRAVLDHALARYAAALGRYMPGSSAGDRERNALVLFAGMAGALSLARAAADEELRRAILDGARDFYVRTFCGPA